jgi:hypothetical protein
MPRCLKTKILLRRRSARAKALAADPKSNPCDDFAKQNLVLQLTEGIDLPGFFGPR